MSIRNNPKSTPLYPWIWTTRPLQRLHIHYADYKGQYLLIVCDSYSKWLEEIPKGKFYLTVETSDHFVTLNGTANVTYDLESSLYLVIIPRTMYGTVCTKTPDRVKFQKTCIHSPI
jgi:hypothetical protein